MYTLYTLLISQIDDDKLQLYFSPQVYSFVFWQKQEDEINEWVNKKVEGYIFRKE